MNQRFYNDFITIDDLISVSERVTTLKEARLSLGMTATRFKKFASLHKDFETELNFYELIKQKKNKGNIRVKYTPIVKKLKKLKKFDLKLVLEGNKRNQLPNDQLKLFLITGGYKKQVCETCGFETQREIDYKVPLKLIYKDKKKYNGKLENLEFICYNCHFLKHPNYKLSEDDEFYDTATSNMSNQLPNGKTIISNMEIDMDDFEKELLKIKNRQKDLSKETKKDYDPYEFVTNKKLI